ncbi:dihydropteroate synthase [Marimonas lutisalis]|uniref:dihydropteroate synthase n=1 Tax=Marimonas lutisalis TaxID=2545756 RepID=UPI0010F9E7E9|nr:dihydropteroate synthase [Marimonas lutisalis]
MSSYFRPLVQSGPIRPADALPLAGGACWFTHAEHFERDVPARVLPVSSIPAEVIAALTAPRADICGLPMDAPRLMGILNVTPDSFSDGGAHEGTVTALAHARAMADAGADLIDIGGESTRPGAREVPVETEIARTAPAISAISSALSVPISIDTRKSAVARAAHAAGAVLVNDVAGFTFDTDLAPFCAETGLPVCVMHALGDPETMQDDPSYDNVLLDVYDWLAARVSALVAQGIPRSRIVVDPGIGFGKTVAHNLALLNGISIFHGLGCPVLLGASRKGFIGKLGRAPQAQDRAPGSVAVALAAAAQGVQILRVHDVRETAQALALWRAVTEGKE